MSHYELEITSSRLSCITPACSVRKLVCHGLEAECEAQEILDAEGGSGIVFYVTEFGRFRMKVMRASRESIKKFSEWQLTRGVKGYYFGTRWISTLKRERK